MKDLKFVCGGGKVSWESNQNFNYNFFYYADFSRRRKQDASSTFWFAELKFSNWIISSKTLFRFGLSQQAQRQGIESHTNVDVSSRQGFESKSQQSKHGSNRLMFSELILQKRIIAQKPLGFRIFL